MQLIRERLRRTRGDHGFTLIELVMSVTILGIVSATLLGVVFQYLRTTTETQARLTESTDQQFISTYWQTDVSSLGRRSQSSGTFTVAQSVFVGSAGPSGCGSSTGSVVVAFAWNEFVPNPPDPVNAWSTTPEEVAYVAVPSGSRLRLVRVRCDGGAARQPQIVARNLVGTPTISCDPACGSTAPLPNRVSMTFTVKDADNAAGPGQTTTVSADRRQG